MSDAAGHGEVRRRPHTWMWAVAALVAVGLLVGLGVYLLRPDGMIALKKRDPSGARACQLVITWLGSHPADKVAAIDADVALSAAAGDLLAKSTTPALRAAGTPPILDATEVAQMNELTGVRNTDGAYADPKKLWTACSDVGVRMPPYIEPTY